MQPRRILPLLSLLVAGLFPLIASANPQNTLLARGRTEPVVAVNPAHPSIVVVGSNTNYDVPVGDTHPTAYFTSIDGGRTFHAGNVPILRPYTTGADPAVAISRTGTIFFAYLGETPSYCNAGSSAVLITTSVDGGRTFRTPTVVDTDPADDKPNLALEDAPGGRTHVFVTWTRWHDSQNTSDIWYARSMDGGSTFGRPAELYSARSDNFGSVPSIGPHRHVYVFWATFPEGSMSAPTRTQILERTSTDDGRYFSAPRSVVGTFWSVPRMAEPGSLRNLTMPAVATSPRGDVYLAWAAARRQHASGSVDADILLSRSTDGGHSWSAGFHVNDRRNGDRFMPAITAMEDGSVGIAFYDRRRSPWDLEVEATRATFQGSFHVTRNVRVNHTNAPVADIYYIRPGSTCFSPGRFFGDYIGAASSGHDSMLVAWADTQLHVYQETDIWIARVSLPGLAAAKHAARGTRAWLDERGRTGTVSPEVAADSTALRGRNHDAVHNASVDYPSGRN